MGANDRRIITGQAVGQDTPVTSTPRDGWQSAYQSPFRPNKPTGLDLNAYAQDGEIWIVADWDPGLPNEAGTVTQWAIETALQGDTLPPLIETVNADQEPPHKIGGLLPNSAYDITVRAIAGPGGSSSDPLTGTITTGHDTTPPPAVTGVAGGAGYKSVTLKWTALGTTLSPFPGKYLIEQSTASDFSANFVQYDNDKSNVANIGNLSTGTQYFFRVRARSASGIDGPASSTVNFTPGLADAGASLPSDGVPPTSATAAPTVTGGPGFFMLKWPSIAGSNQDLLTYEIHMSASPTFTPSSATLVAEAAGTTQGFARKLPSGAALAYGTNYYFAIRTKDRDGYSTGGTGGDGTSPIAGPVQMIQVTGPDIAVHAITAASGIILDLNADVITTGTLNGTNVNVTNLSAAAISSGNISADIGFLGDLTADQITTGVLNGTLVDVQHLNASNITTGTLTASRIGAGSIGAVLIELVSGGTIRTQSYGTSGGTSGWMFDGAGNLVANSVTLRGQLVTTAGSMNIQIGSAGVNEITFNAADQTARGFIQHGNSGYMSIQAPTVSGSSPGYVSMLNNLVSVGVSGDNIIARVAETQFFKPLNTRSTLIDAAQVKSTVASQLDWSSYSFLATSGGTGTRAGISFWANSMAGAVRLDQSVSSIQVVDAVGTSYAPIAASAFNVSSSERTKHAVNLIDDDAVDALMKLDVVTFTRNAIRSVAEGEGHEAQQRNERSRRHGLLAEHVAEHLPSAAFWRQTDAGPIPEGVDYSVVVAVMLAKQKRDANTIAELGRRLGILEQANG